MSVNPCCQSLLPKLEYLQGKMDLVKIDNLVKITSKQFKNHVFLPRFESFKPI